MNIEARKLLMKAIAKAKIKKNVPHDMVSEYLERGWFIHSTHQNYVTLAWMKGGTPT